MNKQMKVWLLWVLAIVAMSTMGVSGCVPSVYDPDLIGVWRWDHGGGCYEYDTFTDSGAWAVAYGVSACGDDNGNTNVGTYTVNTSVTPHQMDIYESGGDQKHNLVIYEVSGDTLQAASSVAPDPRPTDFTEGEYVELVRLP